MNSMMPMPAPFSWRHLNQWHLAPLPLTLLVLVTVAYLLAARRADGWSAWRTTAFVAAGVATVVATQSVIGVYDMELFSAHMVQHLLLIMVAAPLFALATPLELLARTSSRGASFVASKPMTLLLHPVVAFAVYAAFIPATHLSGLFNTMLTTTWFHHAEQVGFLVIGYLFFRQAFGLEEGTTLHPGLRVVFIMAAVPVDTITGLALAMSGHNPFPAYAQMDRMGAMPILSDLHLGGALMWIGGDTLMLLAVIPLVARWVAYETRNTKRIDEELDRLGL